MELSLIEDRIDIEKPKWDQRTYLGRLRHFLTVTNPANLLCTSEDLQRAKDIVTRYRGGEELDLSPDEIWRAKHIYDSAFHPDTGEKMFITGRMSAQVPVCMIIGGCMLTFYKTPRQVIFWLWVNQTSNAIINYTNRSGKNPISVPQLATSYLCATGGAISAALYLQSLVKKAPPLIGRFVPYCAIAVANCINIPLMRRQEVRNGIPITDENGNELGHSANAAKKGITEVVISRNAQAATGMAIPPFLMNHLEKKGFLRRFPWSSAPIQIVFGGLIYTFATPMCCALFPQQSSMKVDKLEPEMREMISKLPNKVEFVYYNKGL